MRTSLIKVRMPAQHDKCNGQFDGSKREQRRHSRDIDNIVFVGRMELPHDRQVDRTSFQLPQFVQGRSDFGVRVFPDFYHREGFGDSVGL